MDDNGEQLNIAEILYESGEVRFRYSRYLAPDGTKWIRHGLFDAYYPNGKLASTGNYEDGSEIGLWKDFHENGTLAAEGNYQKGEKVGEWKYWNSNGELEDEQ